MSVDTINDLIHSNHMLTSMLEDALDDNKTLRKEIGSIKLNVDELNVKQSVHNVASESCNITFETSECKLQIANMTSCNIVDIDMPYGHDVLHFRNIQLSISRDDISLIDIKMLRMVCEVRRNYPSLMIRIIAVDKCIVGTYIIYCYQHLDLNANKQRLVSFIMQQDEAISVFDCVKGVVRQLKQ